jgi:hypothetical protein
MNISRTPAVKSPLLIFTAEVPKNVTISTLAVERVLGVVLHLILKRNILCW